VDRQNANPHSEAFHVVERWTRLMPITSTSNFDEDPKFYQAFTYQGMVAARNQPSAILVQVKTTSPRPSGSRSRSIPARTDARICRSRAVPPPINPDTREPERKLAMSDSYYVLICGFAPSDTAQTQPGGGRGPAGACAEGLAEAADDIRI